MNSISRGSKSKPSMVKTIFPMNGRNAFPFGRVVGANFFTKPVISQANAASLPKFTRITSTRGIVKWTLQNEHTFGDVGWKDKGSSKQMLLTVEPWANRQVIAAAICCESDRRIPLGLAGDGSLEAD